MAGNQELNNISTIESHQNQFNDTYAGGNITQVDGTLQVASERGGMINDSNIHGAGPLDSKYGQFGSIAKDDENTGPILDGDEVEYDGRDSILQKRLVT